MKQSEFVACWGFRVECFKVLNRITWVVFLRACCRHELLYYQTQLISILVYENVTFSEEHGDYWMLQVQHLIGLSLSFGNRSMDSSFREYKSGKLNKGFTQV